MMMKNLYSNIINLVVLLIGVALFVSAQNIQVGTLLGAGSEIVPQLMTTVWVGLGVLILLSGLRKDETYGKKIRIIPFLLTLALLIGYALLLRPIGFVLVSMIYSFAQMMIFTSEELRTKRNYILCGVIAVVFPLVIYNVFANFFSIFLPAGEVIRLPFLFLF
ncbi:MAG: tripartite tricarboxylate transporter TctB family protein [Oscillospiraceae bacterium]|nr:tripartite tricarboxylate transporter TctB family protein [Oscillospiraceae bacterium]